jgi:hypothetical protein
MVLVFDKPSNNIGILQTKLSDREGHETRRVGPEAMPLDQHVEGRHGEGQPCLKYAQPQCITFFTWQTNVSIESTVSTSIRSCHSPR